MTEKAIRIAKQLIAEHKDKISFQNLGKNLNLRSKSEAYIAQDYFHKMAGRGELGGYKIALSSKVQQEHHKINEPLFGALFKSEIFFSPKVINFNSYQRLGVEIELAFKLSNKIHNFERKINLKNISGFIESIYPAIELIEDRKAEYVGLDPLSLICDNAWSGGLIVGDPIKDWQQKNFSEIYSSLFWNNESKKTACVMDANPFENLCWLLNDLRDRKKILLPGMVIISGSVFQIRHAQYGDKITHSLGSGVEACLMIK